jgi:FKBP-type peptidyl-prolyl cis-trans isomerase FklB
MRLRLLCIATLVAALVAGQAAAEQAGIKSENGKRSYSIGYDIGNALKKQAIDVDTNLVIKGLKDALSGKKQAMTNTEMQNALKELQKEIMAKRMVKMKEIADKNKKDGDAFLAENKKKPGIVTTQDGLQYRVIKEGTGVNPTPTSRVKVHYKGTLINGSEFDSSYKRGEPIEFDADKVIQGWQKILPLMKEGSKVEVFIPSELAYGERGQGPVIGPNSVLVFEIELLSVVK